jgi:hypothetical protein
MANERISDLPAAGPILGPELVPVVQNGVTSQSTASAVQAGTVPFGLRSPGLNDTFSSVVQNAPVAKNWIFGTGAVAPPGGTAITDLTTLANEFTPFDGNTRQVTIQEQIEVYQPFNTGNHAFDADHLNLTALNPNSDWNVTVSQVASSTNLNGTSNLIAAMGLANTTGLRVGQLVAVQFHGIYYISAMVANTSVTLSSLDGSPTGAVTAGLIFYLPIDSAVLSVQWNLGDPSLTFAAVPAGALGKQIAVVNIPSLTIFVNRDADYRVTAVTATTATVGPAIDYTSIPINTRILFLSAVTSGQIISKTTWDFSSSSTFFAMELDVDLLGGSASTSLLNISTLAAFNALPADVPWGAWPAFWGYQAPSTGKSTDTSEIDVFEMFNSTTAPTSYIAGSNHGNGLIANRFHKNDSGWSYNSGFNRAPFPLSGRHQWGLIVQGNKTFRYIDDILVKNDDYEWVSQAPFEVICNMSIGSILFAYASNVMFPMFVTNFPSYTFGIRSIQVWYQASP